MRANYTIPKISKTSKYWYVHFRYEGKQYRIKHSYNRIVDLKERQIYFEELAKELLKDLKAGWNPTVAEVVNQKNDLALIPALRFSLEKKAPTISKKTLSEYTGSVNFIETAVNKLGMQAFKITDVKRVHVKLIIEKAKEQREWTNKAHNKHLNHFKAVLSELIQWDIIEVNPAFNVKNLPVAAADANNPASLEDMQKIKKELETNHYNFFVFCITIFHTGIRPEEILKIKLAMVSLKNDEIVLPAEITKTNRKRIVPINSHLKEYYLKLDIDTLPQDYYLFGSFRKVGEGNKGKFADFVPAPTHLKRDTATKRWERLIKKGLEIDMNLYAMKKAGANAKILAGVSIGALKDLFGHSSELTTAIYITKLKEINRKEILDKSPEF
jgi:integrase